MQSNEPYIGSVRFFKNIIFLCCILGVLIPTGLALRWRSRAKTAESLLAQNAVVLTGEEDEAASEAEAASAETEPEADSSDEQEPLSYQLLYPDFYAPTPLPDIEDAGKTIYLTFDDGPSDRTDEVLKILDEKGVKATFFVIGREDETSIQRIKKAAAAGHTIGMHSYSHDYEKIYTSVEDFLDDFYKLFVILRDEAGVTPHGIPFPGRQPQQLQSGRLQGDHRGDASPRLPLLRLEPFGRGCGQKVALGQHHRRGHHLLFGPEEAWSRADA